ncbi:MAG: lytic transglycosylase domain-containing protein [Alphaproteobacteria bacterium]|nr:lytic transglycosylase domain-containing protein [Alphaproteobacteria bacterium]
MLAEAVTDKSQVIAALRQASAATGSDFHYLLGTAMRESGLKTQAQSGTSSACGLFQFVGQTWLGLIKQHGAKYGLAAQAAQITADGDGHFRVADGQAREAILALRKDPKIAALMAGEFTNKTKAALIGSLGRDVCEGELYAAHFLGPAAATKLIQMNEANPDARAAQCFPQAADANRSVFYHADGTPKSVREVYNWALKQPNADTASAPVKTAKAEAPRAVSYDNAVPDDLLNSVLAWSPSRPSFSALDDGDDDTSSVPVKPFLLTPGVMDLLSQVAPSHR